MANLRVGETGLSDSGISNQSVPYGIHGITPSAANFFDQEGAAYFGELEEALMQGVVGFRSDVDRKTFLAAGPPTLEIFPSWPMRIQQASGTEESTDSGSAHNTISQLESDSPVSRKAAASFELPSGHGGQHEAPNHQPKLQDKKRAGDKDRELVDPKTLRRLAQNREAARKSRLRKKVYVQQLESSRIKLAQLEQDLHRARSQGLFIGSGGVGGGVGSTLSSGTSIYQAEYGRWVEENKKLMADLRGALQIHLGDGELRAVVDENLAHYDEFFRLKVAAAKADVLHLISGVWTTPAERCFLWIGGFRPSELLKMLTPHVEPLTEQQVVGICSLQQAALEAEEALSRGLERLQQSLTDAIIDGSLNGGTDPAGNFAGHMGAALGELSNLEGIVRQADNLRQQTLHQISQMLTVRQAARCFLAIGEFYDRLRSLSHLWASRPRENLVSEESSSFSPTGVLQRIPHPLPRTF